MKKAHGESDQNDHEQHLAKRLTTPEALERYERLSIGEEIRNLRAERRMKQAELARRLKTSQSVIARIENGKQNLTLKKLTQLAFALDVNLIVELRPKGRRRHRSA
ncbi:transcriptional regulator [Candidatus Peregrinibacteria bacterium CG_4_9_14_0_2_um_filter_53_11]|nr:MAG: transcriptional regulator [Candidatus Peregrinibacteria bacterium CG_4_9_14_0_2_um_filter_53_11]